MTNIFFQVYYRDFFFLFSLYSNLLYENFWLWKTERTLYHNPYYFEPLSRCIYLYKTAFTLHLQRFKRFILVVYQILTKTNDVYKCCEKKRSPNLALLFFRLSKVSENFPHRMSTWTKSEDQFHARDGKVG